MDDITLNIDEKIAEIMKEFQSDEWASEEEKISSALEKEYPADEESFSQILDVLLQRKESKHETHGYFGLD